MNPIPNGKIMKKIFLTQGKFALVDDEDFNWLNQWKWHYHIDGYAVRNYARISPRQGLFLMHRVIVNCPTDKQIDHIDGDGLNNQKFNLRICVQSQNKKNRRTPSNNTTGYKGVWIDKRRGYIWAGINANGKRLHLGTFSDLISAAEAYDGAARKHYGEFARLNFPNGKILR